MPSLEDETCPRLFRPTLAITLRMVPNDVSRVRNPAILCASQKGVHCSCSLLIAQPGFATWLSESLVPSPSLPTKKRGASLLRSTLRARFEAAVFGSMLRSVLWESNWQFLYFSLFSAGQSLTICSIGRASRHRDDNPSSSQEPTRRGEHQAAHSHRSAVVPAPTRRPGRKRTARSREKIR